MPHNKTPISKVTELLKLKFEHRLLQCKIAENLSISNATVSEILAQFQRSQLEWPLPAYMTDNELECYLYPNRIINKAKVSPQFAAIHKQLKIQGITKLRLWQDYKNQPQIHAYKFTQFCESYKRWLSKQKLSVQQSHKGGDKLFINYFSSATSIVNPDTGELREVIFFVATLGASNKTYIEAFEPDDIEAAVMATVNALNNFGGSTKQIIVHQQVNFGKSTASFKENYQAIAKHYDIECQLVKLKAGQLKGDATISLQVINRWLLMMIRSRGFHTLTSLQHMLRNLTVELNKKPMKIINESRDALFELIDAPSLTPLPETLYKFVDRMTEKVNITFHVIYKKHFYSVPDRYIGKYLIIRAGVSSVKIYSNGHCIAQHPRKHKHRGYSTIADHMPVDKGKHKWSPLSFLIRARKVGSATTRVIKFLLNSKPHPEQSYSTCIGILSMASKYSYELLELACEHIQNQNHINQPVIEHLIKTELSTQSTL
ncbi:hypothetical protein MT390_13975 [Vibrio sp. 2-Bac 85]